MKITSYAVGRPAIGDRASTSILSIFDSTLGPHAQTQRQSYEVPASRKALIEFGLFRLVRTTAATVAGNVTVFSKLFLPASNAVLLFPSNIPTTLNVIIEKTLPTQLTVFAGETIASFTEDLSTGGVNDYRITFKAVEYDA